MFVSHVRYVTGTEQTKEKATAFTHEITVKLNASSTEFYLVKMIIITTRHLVLLCSMFAISTCFYVLLFLINTSVI